MRENSSLVIVVISNFVLTINAIFISTILFHVNYWCHGLNTSLQLRNLFANNHWPLNGSARAIPRMWPVWNLNVVSYGFGMIGALIWPANSVDMNSVLDVEVHGHRVMILKNVLGLNLCQSFLIRGEKLIIYNHKKSLMRFRKQLKNTQIM